MMFAEVHSWLEKGVLGYKALHWERKFRTIHKPLDELTDLALIKNELQHI